MFGKPKNFLGVDIGHDGIKVVELEERKNRPMLFTYALAPDDLIVASDNEKNLNNNITPNNKELKEPVGADKILEEKIVKYGAILRAIKEQAKVTAKSAAVSLPSSAVFHAIVTLPIVDKSQFDKVLQAEIKKLLPLPLEKLSLDYQFLGKDKQQKEQRILINAVEKSRVEFYVKIFHAAGLTLEALEPESTALTRALIGKDMATSMIVDIGAKNTNFFIVDQAVPMTHNTIESGGDKINKILANRLGVSLDLIDQVKRDLFNSVRFNKSLISKDKIFDMISPVLDPVMKEIEYSLELYSRQHGNEGKTPEKIILTGGGSIIPFLPDYIESYFNKKCFLGDPWARIVYQEKLRPVLNKIGPRMSVAVGLALRNMV